MKGGRTPVHIMRVAPADYVNDPWVKLALKRNQPDLLAFYHLFLYHCWLQGGSLPAQEEQLSAVLGLRVTLVRKSLAYWSAPECGLVVVRSGLAWNPRVARDVAKAIEFIDGQAEHGKLGGRGNRKGTQKATLSDTESQPLPLAIANAVASAVPGGQAGLPNPLVDRGRLIPEGYAAIAEIVRLTGHDPTEVLERNSKPKDREVNYRGAVRLDDLKDDRLARTVHDLKAELARLKLPTEPVRSKMPWEKVAERVAQEGKPPGERGTN